MSTEQHETTTTESSQDIDTFSISDYWSWIIIVSLAVSMTIIILCAGLIKKYKQIQKINASNKLASATTDDAPADNKKEEKNIFVLDISDDDNDNEEDDEDLIDANNDISDDQKIDDIEIIEENKNVDSINDENKNEENTNDENVNGVNKNDENKNDEHEEDGNTNIKDTNDENKSNDKDSYNSIKQGFKNLISIIDINKTHIKYQKSASDDSEDAMDTSSTSDNIDGGDTDDLCDNDDDEIPTFYSLNKGNQCHKNGKLNTFKTKSLAIVLNLSKRLNATKKLHKLEVDYSEQETSGCSDDDLQYGLKSGLYDK